MYRTIVIIYLCANSTINFTKLYPHRIKHAIRITSAINITVTKDPENKPDNVFPIDIPNTVTFDGSSSIISVAVKSSCNVITASCTESFPNMP